MTTTIGAIETLPLWPRIILVSSSKQEVTKKHWLPLIDLPNCAISLETAFVWDEMFEESKSYC